MVHLWGAIAMKYEKMGIPLRELREISMLLLVIIHTYTIVKNRSMMVSKAYKTIYGKFLSIVNFFVIIKFFKGVYIINCRIE